MHSGNGYEARHSNNAVKVGVICKNIKGGKASPAMPYHRDHRLGIAHFNKGVYTVIKVGQRARETVDMLALRSVSAGMVVGENAITRPAKQLYLAKIGVVAVAHTVLKKNQSVGSVLGIGVKAAAKDMPTL